jgi:dipeptidyl-peptidase-4
VKNDLWVAPIEGGKPVRITETPDVQEEVVAFSPDGKRIAFVAGNDLYVGDCAAGGATRVTSDGSSSVWNGKLDWLYQEEVYGRGTFRSFWWSPDSASIAFLRLDETGVPPYTIVDDVDHVPEVMTSAYPRPGEPNPTVKIGVWTAGNPSVRFCDLSSYAQHEPLVVSVSWSPKNELVYSVQDREQRWLELRMEARDGQQSHVLLRETSPAWVDRNDEPPTWLADGSFLWSSERTGFKHIYRYKDNQLIGPVTGGEWEAQEILSVDEAKGLVYFSGTERSAIDTDLYVIGLDGKGLKRLTDRAGTHKVVFSPDSTFYTDAWSDLWTPTQVSLHRADGTLVRVLDENKVDTMDRYARSKPELLTVKARDGFEMNAMLVKPVDFDPTRKYPVMM